MKTSLPVPVCIASPVRRSGTTLLQRLLSSADNTLIYGETCANDLSLLTNMYMSKTMLFAHNKSLYNDQIAGVLDGSKINEWIPDLLPPIDGYLQAFKQTILAYLAHFESYASKHDRPIWGLKLPEWHPAVLQQVLQLLPNAKILYIERNLMDCVKSAKKIEMVATATEVNQFCQTWKQFGFLAHQNLKGPNVLFIDYDAMIRQPARYLDQIEAFTGAINIDRKIMDVRVNTYSSDQRLMKEQNAYLSPAELNEEEQNIVNQYVSSITH